MPKMIAILIAISLSTITVISDAFVKKASLQHSVWNHWLVIGAVIYAATAIGWVYVMKSVKLSTLGVIYGITCITLLTAISVLVFHEKITALEIVGIFMGIGSIILLARFG